MDAGQPAAAAVTLNRRRTLLDVEVQHAGRRRHVRLRSSRLRYATDAEPAAVAADAGTLWLGFDWGEWGGALVRVPLAGGKAALVPGDRVTPTAGVTSLVAARGAVWATGGVDHLGLTSAFVLRLDATGAKAVYTAEGFWSEGRAEADRPFVPIHHLRPWPGSEDWLVLAFSEVYRASSDFTRWTRLPDLEVHYRAGRPDAVGTYASIRDLQVGPHGLTALATRFNGVVLLDGEGRPVGPVRPDPLAGGVYALLSTASGLLALGEVGAAWVGPGGLEPVPDLALQWGSVWDVSPEGQARETRFSADGEDVASGPVVRERVGPPPGGEGGWRDDLVRDGGGRLYLVHDEEVSAWDGQTWGAPLPIASTLQGGGHWLGPVPGVAGVLLDYKQDRLLSWSEGGLVGLGPADGVRAAVAWDDEHLLVATSGGLVLVARAGGDQDPAPIGDPGFAPRALARDGCGRTWLLGAGVAVWDRGSLQRLPDVAGVTGHPVG